jgi:hypothetical protein
MVIQRGDTGLQVELIQEALQRAGAVIDVDGDFGRQTEEAVRRFQHEHGLAVDGEVGPETWRALGLETDDAPGQDNVTDVEFERGEVEVSAEVHRRVEELVDAMVSAAAQVLDSTELAIDQFETTMEFGSNSATDVPGALLAEVMRSVGGLIASRIGVDAAFDIGLSIFDAVSEELEEAAAAANRRNAGEWIKSQRTVLDRARQELGPRRRQEMVLDVESSFLESEDKQAAFDALVEMTDRLATEALPDAAELELRLYEQWIKQHFRGIDRDAPGCIEFRYEFDDDTFDFVSCTVAAPFGEQIEDGLNRLFDQRLVSRAGRPFDVMVPKRACFRVDNVNFGGKSWSCGWLDENGNVIHRPIHESAERALNEAIWRHRKRFSRR